MFAKVICFIILGCLFVQSFGKPTIYKRNEDNIYEPGDIIQNLNLTFNLRAI